MQRFTWIFQTCAFIIFFVIYLCQCRYILPEVPEVMYPPIPDEVSQNITITDEDDMDDQDPEVTPGLFQGDMAMTNEIYSQWRVGLNWDTFPDKLWRNGIVPYVISPLYDPSDYVTIYKALKTINYMSCVKFVPWNGKSKDYLLIWPIQYPRGCWSFVGRFGGAQILSLQPPDQNSLNCLGSEGRPIHELLHALGIFHEQSRWDRDKFVKVHDTNIISKFKGNFDKQSLENTTYSFEYDYNSIMHYGRYYFSNKKGKPTLTPTMSDGVKIGQRTAMSKGDCLKLNDLYGCLDQMKSRRKYYRICQFMGL
ncbi:hatching enzyme 1.2 [Onthophagus taurus]|uniref:hatching enzyme 1.2 n=1 Tax=Onthophagus taurus TaxID=166361 RepID=UPI0039BDE962